MNRVEQFLVVDETHQEHADDPAADPVKLLDVRPGELGVRRGAADLHHAQPANQQDEDQQQPVEIAK